MISMTMKCSVQAVQLSCTDTNTVSKQTNEIPHDPRHLRVPSGASKTIDEPMVRSVLTVHLSPNGPNRAPPDPRLLGVPSGVSKIIYEPVVHLMQTEHLSCTDTNTISKQIEMRFHMTHVT
jgi:hypothetical protein